MLWQTIYSEWANQCLKEREAKEITDSVKALLAGHPLPEDGKPQMRLY